MTRVTGLQVGKHYLMRKERSGLTANNPVGVRPGVVTLYVPEDSPLAQWIRQGSNLPL